MPLDKPLTTFKEEMLQLLVTDHKAVLGLLRERLPLGGDAADTVILLFARYYDIQQKQAGGTASSEEMRLLENTLRRDILEFVNDLKEADFDAQPKPTGADRQGLLLYQIPEVMQLKEETKCLVRISLDRTTLWEDINKNKPSEERSLKQVSKTMQVELVDPFVGKNFTIRTTSKPIQTIDLEGNDVTEWRFYVTPLQEGSYTLEVKVSIIEWVDGKQEIREKVLEEEVKIVAHLTTPTTTVLKSTGEALYLAGRNDNTPISEAAGESPDEMEEGFRPSQTGGLPSPSQMPKPSTVVTPSQYPSDGDFTFGDEPAKSGKSSNKMKYLAILLVFGAAAGWLILGKGTLSTNNPSVASINTELEYETAYRINPQSPEAEAYAYKTAMESKNPEVMRRYIKRHGNSAKKGEVLAQLENLEKQELIQVTSNPTAEGASQFAASFPESENISKVRVVVSANETIAKEALPAMEEALVASIKKDPTPAKVAVLDKEFPETTRLDEVVEAVKAKPEVMEAVQPQLEEAYMRQMGDKPTPVQIEEYKKTFPTSKKMKVLEQKIEAEQLEVQRRMQGKKPAKVKKEQ